MLVFIDETWQTIGDAQVGGLGAVAIPARAYNHFCSTVYHVKQSVLGARELSDCELKGNVNFARSAFRKRAGSGHSNLLEAVERVLVTLSEHHARTFAIWTTHEEWLRLRNPSSTQLSQPYRELMLELRRFMRASFPHRQALLFFDQRGGAEDLATACAVQNFMTRTTREWPRRFVQVPHFTRSPISPGLQAADLVAYLAAQQIAPEHRPELAPYWESITALAYEHRTPTTTRRALRLVAAP